MITYWKNGEGITQVPDFQKGCWVEVTNPTPEEIQHINEQFEIAADLINDVLDPDERSRSEIDESWLLIILRIPLQNINNGIPFITTPLGIFLNKETTITICRIENEVTAEIIKSVRMNRLGLHNQTTFVLHLFLQSAKIYLKFLKLINIQTALIEKDLEKSTRNKELHKLLKMEKCLVFFITSLKSNELLLAKLRNSKWNRLEEPDSDLLEDVITENKQAIEMANIYSDIQSGLMDAFASIISNNVTQIMKQLTSVTIILMIPTLVASFYGMNVPNYLENSRYGFLIVILLSVLLSILGVFIIRKKNWF